MPFTSLMRVCAVHPVIPFGSVTHGTHCPSTSPFAPKMLAVGESAAAVPTLVHQKDGFIVNISSMWGERGAAFESIYSASKGALNAFSRALGKELAPSNVRVNAIACGVIDTPMNAHLSEEERRTLCDAIPMGRYGQPAEVAALVGFLAQGECAYLTGQVLTVDGAFS